jgi:hypothetical protein
MRFFGTLLFFLGIALVLLTVLFAYFVVAESGFKGGFEQLGLLTAGAAGALGLGTFARRR